MVDGELIKDELGSGCGTHMGGENRTWSFSCWKRNQLEAVHVDGRIILKWILRK
jgi:hypothetical protein